MNHQTLDTAGALRANFDESFAAPLESEDARRRIALLAVRAGSLRVALRTSELVRIESGRAIAPLPSSDAALLGLAGVRGKLVPVYSLAALLGEAEALDPRWLALCDVDGESAALAFSELEGHVLVMPEDICAASSVDRGHLPEIVRLAGSARGIASIPSIGRAIAARTTSTNGGADAASTALRNGGGEPQTKE